MLFGKKVEITDLNECKGAFYKFIEESELINHLTDGDKGKPRLRVSLGKKEHGAYPLSVSIDNLPITANFPQEIYMEIPQNLGKYASALYQVLEQYFTDNGFRVYHRLEDTNEEWTYFVDVHK